MPDPLLSRRSFGADTALQQVTSLAGVTVKGADGVSIALERHGQMTTVAASDDTGRRMDAHQYATGEGPCLEAVTEGRWIHSESLADEQRWPAFVPRAIDEGIASVLSSPLLVSSIPVGALNVYSRMGWTFGPFERDVAVNFASHAAAILGEIAEIEEDQGAKISAALTSRDIIAMAQGVLMTRLGVSAHAAAAELYRAARRKEITVRAEAVAVLDSTGADRSGPGEDRG